MVPPEKSAVKCARSLDERCKLCDRDQAFALTLHSLSFQSSINHQSLTHSPPGEPYNQSPLTHSRRLGAGPRGLQAAAWQQLCLLMVNKDLWSANPELDDDKHFQDMVKKAVKGQLE